MSRRTERKYRPVRTPMVLQMEAVECGAAALGIILEYHGRYVPLDVLRSTAGSRVMAAMPFTSRRRPSNTVWKPVPFASRPTVLVTRQPPFMVLWQWNHFLVVEGFGRGIVFLNDPACGRRTVSYEEFARCYSGIAFTFTPGPQFVRQGRRPGAAIGLARRLAKSKSALAFVILAGLALLIPTLATAGFQRLFVDEILVQGRYAWLKPLLFAMGLTAMISLAAVGLQQVYLTRLEIRLALTESVKFLQHVLRLPLTFFQYRFAGDIVGRIVSTGARGPAHFRRTGNHGRQPLDPGFLCRVDASLRPPPDMRGSLHQQLEPDCPALAQPLAGRSEPGHRADSRPALGRGHVGNPDH